MRPAFMMILKKWKCIADKALCREKDSYPRQGNAAGRHKRPRNIPKPMNDKEVCNK